MEVATTSAPLSPHTRCFAPRVQRARMTVQIATVASFTLSVAPPLQCQCPPAVTRGCALVVIASRTPTGLHAAVWGLHAAVGGPPAASFGWTLQEPCGTRPGAPQRHSCGLDGGQPFPPHHRSVTVGQVPRSAMPPSRRRGADLFRLWGTAFFLAAPASHYRLPRALPTLAAARNGVQTIAGVHFSRDYRHLAL